VRRGFEIECSSGTYVRTLIAELGDAYCEQLRRTAIGDFEVSDADPERPVALNDALSFLPEVALDDELARLASHGAAVPIPGPVAPIVRLTDSHGLIALAEPGPAPGTAKPMVGLR
jgi:tRNA pseudouridine55 synthase